MPFASKLQAKWMYANKPKLAKEWAKKTPNFKSLPKKTKKSKGKKTSLAQRIFADK